MDRVEATLREMLQQARNECAYHERRAAQANGDLYVVQQRSADLETALKVYRTRLEYCHAGRDGDCDWAICPQPRDGEPRATGQDCPLREENPDD